MSADGYPPPVNSFTGEHAFLSNFAASPIHHGSCTYPTAEHLFQALKCVGLDHRTWVQSAPTPGEAKRRGRHVAMVANWEQIKRPTMLRVVLAKFEQNPDLAKQLDATWGRQLIEGNTWNDRYWGAVEYGPEDRRRIHLRVWYTAEHATLIGHNWLGRILMFVREVLHDGGPDA